MTIIAAASVTFIVDVPNRFMGSHLSNLPVLSGPMPFPERTIADNPGQKAGAL
jgi:hypothetical protein